LDCKEEKTKQNQYLIRAFHLGEVFVLIYAIYINNLASDWFAVKNDVNPAAGCRLPGK